PGSPGPPNLVPGQAYSGTQLPELPLDGKDGQIALSSDRQNAMGQSPLGPVPPPPIQIAAPLGASPTDTHYLVNPAISPLVSGGTYYVTNTTTNTFQLAMTPDDAAHGRAISLDSTLASGNHRIGMDRI